MPLVTSTLLPSGATSVRRTARGITGTSAETVGSSATAQVGYGVIDSGTAVGVLRSFSAGALVSEAAVPATNAGAKWIMYAEKSTSGVSTGVAIANPIKNVLQSLGVHVVGRARPKNLPIIDN